MNFSVVLTPDFQKDAKKLLKKYPSLKAELGSLLEQLEENPAFGTLLMDNVYKVRLAIKSKNKGKSGGARTIHFVYNASSLEGTNKVYLLTIYDKSEFDSVSDSSLKSIVESIQMEATDDGIPSQEEE
jgi:mRNA-degrading endonuclease RelE of RelBE toxin-antitoxin system